MECLHTRKKGKPRAKLTKMGYALRALGIEPDRMAARSLKVCRRFFLGGSRSTMSSVSGTGSAMTSMSGTGSAMATGSGTGIGAGSPMATLSAMATWSAKDLPEELRSFRGPIGQHSTALLRTDNSVGQSFPPEPLESGSKFCKNENWNRRATVEQ